VALAFLVLPSAFHHRLTDAPWRRLRHAEVRCHGDTRRRSTISSFKGHQPTGRRRAYRVRQHGARCGAVCVWREWSRPHVWGHRDALMGMRACQPYPADRSTLARCCRGWLVLARNRRRAAAATILWPRRDAPGRMWPRISPSQLGGTSHQKERFKTGYDRGGEIRENGTQFLVVDQSLRWPGGARG
jgi:hypothetical protein